MLINGDFNFHQLEKKFGPAMAYQCLVEIERAAHIPSWTVYGLDPEIRLANALRIQDAINDNTKH